jgi:pimeloyl-ACP methyl ester carboxylesterase
MEVQVNGYAVHVERGGHGPPALFVHGVPDSAEIWDEVIAGVADRYTCHAADFQGVYRYAVNPHFPYNQDGYADWLEALVTALGINEPITLVVHDWGGPIGLAWACKYPHRIARVLAINTVFTSRYRWHFWARVWRTPLLGELAMLLMSPVTIGQELRRGSRKLSRERIRKMAQGAPSLRSTRWTWLKLYRSLDPAKLVDADAQMRALAAKAPVQVLWGEHDPYIPRWVAGSFHTERVEFVPGCGHWVPAEAPEAVISVLRDQPN